MLKSHVFVGNTGHPHNEIDFAGSEGLDGVKVKAGGPFQSEGDKKLSSVLMLFTFMTIHFFQFSVTVYR